MKLCNKLPEIPSVATDWQQTTWCPDCEHYDLGACSNPTRTDRYAPCPFDGKELPLREVTVDPNHDQPQRSLDAALRAEPESQPRSAVLEQAIRDQIVQRTRGRIQTLEVEVIDSRVVIRGCAPCFHVKQLALRGVLDVIGSTCAIRVEHNLQVPECPALFGPDA